jgi:hypothetical protein
MKSWAAALALAGLLLCCCVAQSKALYGVDCPNPNDPVKCLNIGDRCLSKVVSQCKETLTCPVNIGDWSTCQRVTDIKPQCSYPAVHCKDEGDNCAPAPISQCRQEPVKLRCDKVTGKCIRK